MAKFSLFQAKKEKNSEEYRDILKNFYLFAAEKWKFLAERLLCMRS